MITEKEIQFIPLTSDYMFKKIFIENPDILKKFLISVLKLNLNPETSQLTFLNTVLPKAKRKEYNKTVDILVSIDEKRMIDVEINSESYEYIKDRNTFYIEKIISMGVEKSTSYEEMSSYYFYQLNLNKGGKSNFFPDKYFTFKDSRTNEELSPNFKIIYKSLDYYRKVYYNENELISNDILWLMLIDAADFKELKEYTKLLMNGQEYQKFMKSVRDGCMEEMSIANWESDKMAALVKAKKEEAEKRERERAEKEALEKGFKQGREEGIEQGIAEEKNQVIKNLLKKNMSYKDISEVSGKTIDEIKEIEVTITHDN